MKKVWLLLLVWALPAVAQETTPPKFQGTVPERFAVRLTGEFEKVVYDSICPASVLTEVVEVAFTIDTTGMVTDWRYLDFQGEGAEWRDADPPTPQTQQMLETALGRLEKWTPAKKGGCSVPYNLSLRLQLPVNKIAHKQNPDPLLFKGENPNKSFRRWLTRHIRYDDSRFKSEEGTLTVSFSVEADGTVVIDKVENSPSEKLTKEIVRVIERTRGRWTPRKINGVPVSTWFEYEMTFFGE